MRTIPIFLFLCFTSGFSQVESDSSKLVMPTRLDTINLSNGTKMTGHVTKVKSDVIQFTEDESKLDYEIRKAEIGSIVLSNGKIITFSNAGGGKPGDSNADSGRGGGDIGIEINQHAVVIGFKENSSAKIAGIYRGDRIVAIDDQPIPHTPYLEGLIAQMSGVAGTYVKIEVARDNSRKSFMVQRVANGTVAPIPAAKPIIIQQESGPSTGLAIAAGVGITLAVLLLISAIASH